MNATDIIEIHQLLGLYGHIVDAGEWDRFTELFEDDAVLDYTGVRAPRAFVGVAEIADYFRCTASSSRRTREPHTTRSAGTEATTRMSWCGPTLAGGSAAASAAADGSSHQDRRTS